MHTTTRSRVEGDSASSRAHTVESAGVRRAEVAPTAFGGRVRVDARGDRLWRVSTDAFAVIGHVELLDTARGEVYLAKRYSPTHARFVDRGRFWSMDDALECLWYSA